MRYLLLTLALILATSCSTPSRFIVSNMGYEPAETIESVIYALPKTSLKVKVDFRRDVFVPGPYADYTTKLLGIEGVRKHRQELYTLISAEVSEVIEPDASHFYSINSIEGEFDRSFLEWAESKKLVLAGDYRLNTSFEVPELYSGNQPIYFKDVTMESNVELKTETIYKTILTDTSFLTVPVTSEQIQRKTLETKAAEAAKLILEIRSDRYYISAGLLDPYPDNFDIQTALASLDKLESEYLSLFIGKSYSENFAKEFFITPKGLLENEVFELGRFSSEKGITNEGGEKIQLVVKPDGNSASFRNLLPQQPESEVSNKFYYRIPEICEVQVQSEGKILFQNRMSIYQSGMLVNVKAY